MSQTDGKLTPGDYRQITAWLVGSMAVAAACATLTANIVAGSDARVIVALWLSGAASLGLLSGYTTGASKEAGAASEFLKYLSGGVLIPLLGGAAGLVQGSETITKSYLAGPQAVFHPIAVVGGFLIFYGLFAAVGIVIGIYSRGKEISINLK